MSTSATATAEIGSFWHPKGFIFSKPLTETLRSALLHSTTALDRSSPEERKKLAEKNLVALFRSLCRHRHCNHGEDFYKHVNADIKVGVANCSTFEEIYVAARQQYIDANGGYSPACTLLTKVVDKWLNIHSPTPKKEESNAGNMATYPMGALALRPKETSNEINPASIPEDESSKGQDTGIDIDEDDNEDMDVDADADPTGSHFSSRGT